MGETGGLVWFYENIDIFLLVFTRLIGFMVIMPVLSGTSVPAVVRVGLAFFIAFIVVSSGTAIEAEHSGSLFGYSLLLFKEFAVGFTAAFSVYMVFSIFYFIGQLVDFQVGFSMVSVFDPVSQIQVPITGNLFYLLVTMFLIQSGGFASIIYTAAKSFSVVPIGAARLSGNAAVMRYVMDMVTFFFQFGVKISLPIVGTIMIVDVALGLLTKAVPQMNVFVVGMPVKLLVGLLVLFLIIPAFYSVYEAAFGAAVRFMHNIIRGMAAVSG